MGRKTDKPVESFLKDHNDVTLKAFMVNDLHLSGNELIVFAVVYSFSQDGESWFYGSRKYLASWCQVQVGAIDYQLKKLVEKGLVLKRHERRDDGSVRCLLKANLPLIESMRGQSQKFEEPVAKIYDTHSQKFESGQSQKFETNNKEEDTQANTEANKGVGQHSAAIDAYTDSPELRDALHEFVKMRKQIKAPMTERAVVLLFGNLDKLATTDAEKVAVLDQSIANSWRGVFELKPENRPKGVARNDSPYSNLW